VKPFTAGKIQNHFENKLPIVSVTVMSKVIRTISNKAIAWTNFGQQDKTWANFSTKKAAACVPCTCAAMK
jgi:hypothetical protein